MQYEVERKFRLSETTSLISAVESLGGTFSDAEHHSDTYYAHPARSFVETDEALRIRSIGEQHFVTYKGPRIDRETKTRKELELPLPVATADGSFHDLLLALGFTPVATVKKSRCKAKLECNGREFEIDLDDVEGVGSFVELETCVDESELAPAKTDMQALAEQLPIGEDERRGYLEMLLENS